MIVTNPNGRKSGRRPAHNPRMQWAEPAGRLLWFESRRGAGSATDRHSVMQQEQATRRLGDRPLVRLAVSVVAAHLIASYLSFASCLIYLWKVGKPVEGDWFLRIAYVGLLWWIEVFQQLETIAMFVRHKTAPFFVPRFDLFLVVSYLCFFAIAFVLASRLRWCRPRSLGVCAKCGYDLRATVERCPEYGQVVATRPAA